MRVENFIVKCEVKIFGDLVVHVWWIILKWVLRERSIKFWNAFILRSRR